MKGTWIAILIVLVFILILLFWISSSTKYDDDFIKMNALLIEQNAHLEKLSEETGELRKEIRLLKTDLDIKENGFPEKVVDEVH